MIFSCYLDNCSVTKPDKKVKILPSAGSKLLSCQLLPEPGKRNIYSLFPVSFPKIPVLH